MFGTYTLVARKVSKSNAECNGNGSVFFIFIVYVRKCLLATMLGLKGAHKHITNTNINIKREYFSGFRCC